MTRPLLEQDAPKRETSVRYWLWFALVSYCVVLVVGFARHQAFSPQQSLWDLQDTGRFLDWILERMVAGLVEVALFVPLGFLLWLSWRGNSTFAHGLLLFFTGFILTMVIVGVCLGTIPDNLDLVFPTTGYAMGTWIGWRWLRGTRGRLWLVPQLVLILLAIAAMCVGFIVSVVEAQPLAINAVHVTSAEKRRLVALVRNGRGPEANGVSTRSLRLEERDVDLFLAWGLSLGSPGRLAKVELGDGSGILLASVEVPGIWRNASYFNLQGAAQCDVSAGSLRFRLERLNMGRLELPRWALMLLTPLAVSVVEHDPNLGRILASVESLQIEPGVVEVTYRTGAFREVPALLERLGAKDSVLTSTEAQIRRLLQTREQLPEGDEGFGYLWMTAFELASERSRAGSASDENRAAIYALGVLAGHHRVADLVGLTFDALDESLVRRGLGPVTLRGRRDWPRHFFVSAALAQLSAESVSDAVGLLKEELDAGDGRGGFSFSDLLADRAGTMFSMAATRDEQAARSMQARLSRGFRVDDFFPYASDLPDGIPDEELQAQYGGIGGPAFKQMEQEIEHRLAACAGLK